MNVLSFIFIHGSFAFIFADIWPSRPNYSIYLEQFGYTVVYQNTEGSGRVKQELHKNKIKILTM